MIEIRISLPYEKDITEYVCTLKDAKNYISKLPSYYDYEDIQVAEIKRYDIYDLMQGRLDE